MTVPHHREKPWMCHGCGSIMDAASAVDGSGGVPEDGDATVCIACGALFCLEFGRWRPMTADEYTDLDPITRAELRAVRMDVRNINRAKTIIPDAGHA